MKYNQLSAVLINAIREQQQIDRQQRLMQKQQEQIRGLERLVRRQRRHAVRR